MSDFKLRYDGWRTHDARVSYPWGQRGALHDVPGTESRWKSVPRSAFNLFQSEGSTSEELSFKTRVRFLSLGASARRSRPIEDHLRPRPPGWRPAKTSRCIEDQEIGGAPRIALREGLSQAYADFL